MLCHLQKEIRFFTDKIIYSVMQSDGDSFFLDVVFDRFNKAFWDIDNILD